MNKKGHAVRWRSEVYYLSELTPAVKDAFCAWIVRKQIENLFRVYDPVTALRLRAVMLTPNGQDDDGKCTPVWTSLPDEMVATALGTKTGHLYLNRLLFGFEDREMDDKTLTDLIHEKEVDPISDYMIAMKLLQDSADPKAKPASDTSLAGKDENGSMQHSETNHSTESPKSTPA